MRRDGHNLNARNLVHALMTGFLLAYPAAQVLAADASDETGEINACSLLSQDEIEAQLKLKVGPPERNDQGYVSDGAFSSVCIWRIVKADSSLTGADVGPSRQYVILSATAWPQGKGMARNFLDAFYIAAEKGEIASTPVARKLGDDALWWGDGLAVRRGDISFGLSVAVRELKAKAPGKSEEALARKILQRIDQGHELAH